MNAIFSKAARLRKLLRRESLRQSLFQLGALPKTLIVLVALGAIAYGGQVTIFQDDFNGYLPGANPTTPQIGEPWQIREWGPEEFTDGLSIVIDEDDLTNHLLTFGSYRNSAVVPISVTDQQRIAAAHNATVSFDYRGYSTDGFSHYFDVSGYNPITGNPAFFLRFDPQETLDAEGMYNVSYRDPNVPGLVDTGLAVSNLAQQRISIAADLLQGTYQLDIGGDTATLPMFTFSETIAEIRFENYGVAMGSGTIDDVAITVNEAKGQQSVPELATIWLLLSGGLVCVYVWLFRR